MRKTGNPEVPVGMKLINFHGEPTLVPLPKDGEVPNKAGLCPSQTERLLIVASSRLKQVRMELARLTR